jgi:hypothetical protein
MTHRRINIFDRYLIGFIICCKDILEKEFWMRRNDNNAICGYSYVDWTEGFDRKLIIDLCTFISKNLVT